MSAEPAARVAIVTGGSRGIGLAIARRLANDGAAVVIASRDASDGERAVAGIAEFGGAARAIPCDVAVATDVERLIERTLDAYGRIDVIVNNAGISPVTAEPQDFSEADWDRIFDVNLKGVFLVCRAAAPTLIARSSGVIVNIASIAGSMPIPLESAYCASKAGLIGYSRALAFDWAKYGIRVHAVAPGYIATEMNAGVRAAAEAYARSPTGDRPAAGDLYGAVTGRTLLRRFGLPEEVAEVVAFLTSERASYMTGELIHVDGGWTIGEPPARWP